MIDMICFEINASRTLG